MPRGRDGGVNGPDQLQVRRTSNENLSKALGDMRAHGDHALLQASWDGQNEIIKRLVKAGCNSVNTARWDNAVRRSRSELARVNSTARHAA